MAKNNAKKSPTKSEVFRNIAEKTELSRKQVAGVFDEMTAMISRSVKKGGGPFTIPGLCKIVVRRIPARPAAKNKWIPLLKEFRDIAAKPARNVIKVRPLKALKEMV